MWHCKVINLITKEAREFVYDTLDFKTGGSVALNVPFTLKEYSKVPFKCYVKYIEREAK